MKKTFLFISMLFVGMISQAQILYKISGNGLKKDSYIMGTEHTIGGSFLFEIPGAFAALNSVDQACGELSPREAAKSSKEMTLLPEGKTIKDVMTEDEFKRLDDCIMNRMGRRLSDEAMYAELGRMKPVMISNTISISFVMEQKPRHMITGEGIDAYITQMAMNKGKGVLGLETMEFQLKTLFADPIEKQVEDLMCLVDNIDSYKTLSFELTNAYLSQDMERIEKAIFAKLGSKCDPTPEEEDRLIFNRNKDWAEKIPEIMKIGSTFFAVGVGHLCGEKSVLALLKKKGYTVEAVK